MIDSQLAGSGAKAERFPLKRSRSLKNATKIKLCKSKNEQHRPTFELTQCIVTSGVCALCLLTL